MLRVKRIARYLALHLAQLTCVIAATRAASGNELADSYAAVACCNRFDVGKALRLAHSVERGKLISQAVELLNELGREYIARDYCDNNYAVVAEGPANLVIEMERAIVACEHFG